jgi:hypothetical protein
VADAVEERADLGRKIFIADPSPDSRSMRVVAVIARRCQEKNVADYASVMPDRSQNSSMQKNRGED